jgi:hypothetical protein
MAGANAVFKAALGRTKAGSSFGGSRSTHRAMMTDGSGSLVNTNQPNMHLATTGPGSAAPIATATAERRTFRGYAPQK